MHDVDDNGSDCDEVDGEMLPVVVVRVCVCVCVCVRASMPILVLCTLGTRGHEMQVMFLKAKPNASSKVPASHRDAPVPEAGPHPHGAARHGRGPHADPEPVLGL